MDFSLTTEQIEMRDILRGVITDLASDDVLVTQHDLTTGYMPNVWERLSRAGWMSLSVPEAFGGAGASFSDRAIVLEEFGRGPLPQLFFVAATLSPLLIMETASEKQKAQWLPRVADGDLRITASLTHDNHEWSPEDVQSELIKSDGGFLLRGKATFVPDPTGATHILVAVRIQGPEHIGLVLLDLNAPGISHEVMGGFVSWQEALVFNDVEIGEENILGSKGLDAWAGIERAAMQALPLMCSYQVGSCQAVFEMTLSHSRTRVQFGQPVGRFQRVQDHVIELVNHLDAARWATYETIWKWETGSGSLAASVHMAKSIVGDGHWEACNFAHEVHAGLGADLKYGLAKHTYLSRTLFHFLGEPRWHREKMAGELGWL